MKNLKKGVLGVVFGLASIGLSASTLSADCCKDPLNDNPDTITYTRLKNADIIIPTYNHKTLKDGRTQFDIRKRDFSTWRLLFSQTMGLYEKNRGLTRNSTCPYIKIPDRYFSKKHLSNGIIRVTMNVSPAIINIVKDHGCVVTNRPSL